MWSDCEVGRVIKRSVKDEKGKNITKKFQIQKIVKKQQTVGILDVIDLDNITKCTLKMVLKRQSLEKNRIKNQIKNQKKMQGKYNFINLMQYFEDSTTIYLLMQRWGITLHDVIQKRIILMQQQVELIFCQLIDILQKLRINNMIHNNINLHSILFKNTTDNTLKITNFQYSIDINDCVMKGQRNLLRKTSDYNNLIVNSSTNQKSSVDGRQFILLGNREINQFTSPQQYNQERNQIRYIYSRDIWNCGVLLYKLLTGLYPFSDHNSEIILEKIKNATFSFPTIHHLDAHTNFSKNQLHYPSASFSDMFLSSSECEQIFNSHGLPPKNNKQLQFVSIEWKQLIKRMLSVKTQRITLRQLLNHPFKQKYNMLKSIPSIYLSQPDFNFMFSKKQEEIKDQIYKKSWDINFQDQYTDSQDQVALNAKVNIKKWPYRYNRPFDRIENTQPQIGSCNNQSMVQQRSQTVQRKTIHKHQSGFFDQSHSKQWEHQKTNKFTLNKQFNPFNENCLQQSPNIIPYIVKQPTFIIKFKYYHKSKYLAYIINNSIGILFNDGQKIIGHNTQQYKYIKKDAGQMMEEHHNNSITNKYFLEGLLKNNKFPRSVPNELKQPNDVLKYATKNKSNFQSEQVSRKDLQSQNQNEQQHHPNTKQNIKTSYSFFKGNNSPSVLLANAQTSKQLGNLAQKQKFFFKAINYFGERVVKSNLNIWIDKFWRDGNVFVFLLNNGCWQVAFCQVKKVRIHAIDEWDLSWYQEESSSDILHCVRQIVNKYKLINAKSELKR